MTPFPERIVCLTAETSEIVYCLGAQDRLVGVPAYAKRPEDVREIEKIGGFTSVDLDRVLSMRPDLVLSFSDLQRDTVRDLLGAGVNVLGLNQRTLEETWQSVLLIGRALGLEERAEELVAGYRRTVEEIRRRGAGLPRHPRVHFEEWDDPMIAGIGWIGEMIEIAGGVEIFPEFRDRKAAPDRIVDGDLVVQRDPEILFAAWCGKKVNVDGIRNRPGWAGITAVKENRIISLPDELFLAPGPALLDGLRLLHDHMARAM